MSLRAILLWLVVFWLVVAYIVAGVAFGWWLGTVTA